jgi:hypothetical protein
VAELERRARRAGWLPELRAGIWSDHGWTRGWDRDAVLSSGVLHELFDRDGGRDRELRLGLELEWDLTRTALPGDALEISRERRQLIELRDQILERVNRLYFERQRVRERLPAASSDDERRELELRARELSAQLDGWTGGWFSRRSHDSLR